MNNVHTYICILYAFYRKPETVKIFQNKYSDLKLGGKK